ncbi:1,3-beta-glucan synthase component, partial [Musa troglodytarum]
MASGSKHPPGRGGNGSADPKVRRTLSRKPTMLNVPQEEEATLLADSELVPILRVANEIETFSPRARPWWAGSCCNLLTAIDYSQPEMLGTKAHYCGRPILRGRAKYRTTGHSFVLFHAKFADNYCMLSRSHFCLRTRAVDIVDRLLSIWKFTTKLNAVPVRH